VNVLLIGLRGSGKSTIGRELAGRLNRPFVDLDERVLATFAEASVSEVWSAHGEAAWREAEVSILEAVLRGADQVIALGGGTPMIADARRRIESCQRAGEARMVYLQCDVGKLARRLSRDVGDRPSLTGADPIDEIRTVLEARETTYQELADFVCDVSDATPEVAAESIEGLFRQR
jgi:shikimate kinase